MRPMRGIDRARIDFRRYVRAEVNAMLREFGDAAHGDVDAQNSLAIEWIRKNAVRFRAEWYGRRGLRRAG